MSGGGRQRRGSSRPEEIEIFVQGGLLVVQENQQKMPVGGG